MQCFYLQPFSRCFLLLRVQLGIICGCSTACSSTIKTTNSFFLISVTLYIEAMLHTYIQRRTEGCKGVVSPPIHPINTFCGFRVKGTCMYLLYENAPTHITCMHLRVEHLESWIQALQKQFAEYCPSSGMYAC